MHLRFSLIALTGLLGISASASAQEAAPQQTPVYAPAEGAAAGEEENTPASMVRAFFISLGKGEVDAAYDRLLTGTRIAETPTDVLMLKKKTHDALGMVGGIRGAELLDKKTPTPHLYALTYVSLGAEYPLQWRFYFYKRASGWKLIDIRISDRLAELFNEKAEASEAQDRE